MEVPPHAGNGAPDDTPSAPASERGGMEVGVEDEPAPEVVVVSFLFVLGTKGRMQPVVMAPKNLSTKHYRLK